MNRFSARSYRNLLGVSPELVAVATLALERSQIDFAITEGVRTLKRPGPVVSIPDSSADRTDAAASADALSGIDVLQWYPAQPDWDVFGKLSLDRYTPERIYQPEGHFRRPRT